MLEASRYDVPENQVPMPDSGTSGIKAITWKGFKQALTALGAQGAGPAGNMEEVYHLLSGRTIRVAAAAAHNKDIGRGFLAKLIARVEEEGIHRAILLAVLDHFGAVWHGKVPYEVKVARKVLDRDNWTGLDSPEAWRRYNSRLELALKEPGNVIEDAAEKAREEPTTMAEQVTEKYLEEQKAESFKYKVREMVEVVSDEPSFVKSTYPLITRMAVKGQNVPGQLLKNDHLRQIAPRDWRVDDVGYDKLGAYIQERHQELTAPQKIENATEAHRYRLLDAIETVSRDEAFVKRMLRFLPGTIMRRNKPFGTLLAQGHIVHRGEGSEAYQLDKEGYAALADYAATYYQDKWLPEQGQATEEVPVEQTPARPKPVVNLAESLKRKQAKPAEPQRLGALPVTARPGLPQAVMAIAFSHAVRPVLSADGITFDWQATLLEVAKQLDK